MAEDNGRGRTLVDGSNVGLVQGRMEESNECMRGRLEKEGKPPALGPD